MASNGIGAQTRRKRKSAYEASFVLSLAASYSWTVELWGEKMAGRPRCLMFAQKGSHGELLTQSIELTY